jgi:hypothetical protein
MIVGFDDDLASEATRVANRLDGLLTQIHPSPERAGAGAAVATCGRPDLAGAVRLTGPDSQGLPPTTGHPVTAEGAEDRRAAGRRHLHRAGRADRHRSGTEAAALIVPSLAGSLADVLDQRRLLAGRIEELLEAHPLSRVLTSMPGVGVRAGARILIEVGDGSTFPTAGHLAAYAGLAPATRSIGVLDPRRTTVPKEKQAAQMGLLPLRVRRSGRPRVPGLLRQEDRLRQAPRPGPAPPRQTPGRCPLRDAPRTNLLRTPASLSGLILSGLAAHGTVPLVDRVQHDGMTAKVARPHAFAGRLPNRRVITHDSHTATRPP